MNPRSLRDLLTCLGLTVTLAGPAAAGCTVGNPPPPDLSVDRGGDRGAQEAASESPESAPETSKEVGPDQGVEPSPEPKIELVAVENPPWEVVPERPAEPPTDGGQD